MGFLNKVQLIGNLGRDPELRYTASGAAVCTISIATTRTWKDKAGERQEATEWHRVVAYDRYAEVIGEYTSKGSSLYVEGRLQTNKWTDKDGVERYTTEIIVEAVQLLGSRNGDGGDGGGQRRRSPQEQQAEPRRAASDSRGGAPRAGAARQPAKSSTGFDDMDDDIPF